MYLIGLEGDGIGGTIDGTLGTADTIIGDLIVNKGFTLS
jgi:hypothetical protein